MIYRRIPENLHQTLDNPVDYSEYIGYRIKVLVTLFQLSVADGVNALLSRLAVNIYLFKINSSNKVVRTIVSCDISFKINSCQCICQRAANCSFDILKNNWI